MAHADASSSEPKFIDRVKHEIHIGVLEELREVRSNVQSGIRGHDVVGCCVHHGAFLEKLSLNHTVPSTRKSRSKPKWEKLYDEVVPPRYKKHASFVDLAIEYFAFYDRVCFEKGDEKRRIPQLKVDHNTECVFRNLIAFEQCHYPENPYICKYVSLIDSLIHTQLDVELLVEKEVIIHNDGCGL
ncbi:unnamed protein product [Sphenostylis stenocarpa]|uniref:Uncharacterized protein n=1 Tax=Sphenostylis stenocarpa TaxID=92480 RepID=A0AA86S990_9FABA|nr:unnamed protein product [Sphenostylis stenocarpa]